MRKLGLFIVAAALLTVVFVYNRDRPVENAAPISRDEAAGVTSTTAVSTTYLEAKEAATWKDVAGVITSETAVYSNPLQQVTPPPTTPVPLPQRTWTLPAGTRVTIECKAGLEYFTSDGTSFTPSVFVYYDSGKPEVKGQGYVSGNAIEVTGRRPDTNEKLVIGQIKLC
ncbi:Uncharacterised protein [Mycobacteroides abscessus]|uniref:hypothetical protein n=2 Tax=Mycobacteroides abscessus TaxID=36809 RepID=UPI0005E66C6F|nr:hypothetical protein [Mycobacteroides abscessus]CPT93973.1 Uncharacterised protein [Mycobacteroides abscessus]CPW13298.1 Uncharacterised protein [Mycobacteroides abscessus]SHZ39353.1 Uncharacterised protein [Mycobacteroides abscessus subsp. abscessus]SHZ41190.1 Uncharacterised protein [Mycobacteroides abscessus subsp. abscessus]